MSSSDRKTFLSPVKALILEPGLGKTRANILAKQLANHGGEVVKTLSCNTTHILIGNACRLVRVPALLKVDTIPEGTSVLRADWLSACLTKKQLLSQEDYRVYPVSGTSSISSHPSSPKTPPKVKPSKSPTRSRHNDHDQSEVSDPAQCQESNLKSADPALLTPKAGMFSVANRQWGSPTTPDKDKARARVTVAVLDSGSDYIESEEEEEEEHGDDAAPQLKKVRDVFFIVHLNLPNHSVHYTK